MALLTAEDARRVWEKLVEVHLAPDGPVNYTKADLETAVAAVDSWIEANAPAAMVALATDAPAFAGTASLEHQSYLFILTAMMKFGAFPG